MNYTVSQKIVPPLTCCNLYIHGSIAAIFGKKCCRESKQSKILYFPTSSN